MAGSKAPCARQSSIDGLVDAGVGGVRDHREGVGLLAVGAPHVARGADHRRHRGVDDDVGGHVQVGDALVGVDHGHRRAVGQAGLDGRLDRVAVGQVVDARRGGRRGRRWARCPRRPAARRTARRASGKNACTTWPKMIGSETFIIVALRCTENSTSSALARAICSVRKRRSAATFMNVPSTTSPARTGMRLLEHRLGAVGGDVLDGQGVVGVEDDGLLVGEEVVLAHGGDVGLRVAAPGPIRCGCAFA